MRPFHSFVATAVVFAACTAQAQLKAPQTGGARAATTPAAATTAASAPRPTAADAEKEEAGRNVAAGWLLLLDRGDWGGAWDRSAGVFRQTVPLPAWMDGVPNLRAPLGALVERTAVTTAYKTSLPGRPDGDYVTTIFASRFEKKEEVQETVTVVREADGKWRVTGYSVR